MAVKTKPVNKNTKQTGELKQEKEEAVEVKELLKDERTHKIAGSICLLLAILFFIAFTSYLFTWDEDQDKVFKEGYKLLLGTDTKVANLMGTFGAFIAHLLIYKGFGVASYLICTFFFIIGINLFFGKKVFSVLRNIKYLIVGLPLLSITASVIMQGNDFAWGGAVGDMCRDYFYSAIGKIGTIGCIAVAFFAYVIWRFNPSFSLPQKSTSPLAENDLPAASLHIDNALEPAETNETPLVNNDEEKTSTGNIVTDNAGILNIQNLAPVFDDGIELTERDDAAVAEKRGPRIVNTVIIPPKKTINEAAADDLLNEGIAENYEQETPAFDDAPIEMEIIPVHKTPTPTFDDIQLEVKTVPEEVPTPQPISAAEVKALTPYDPILDLRDYKYPVIDLLENHGSEKIVQDPQELENNKNQIITTLKNYDIDIQRISATVGPTVTLYEIIPAAGVRISRIKNLEDDIALSLAALGIRIIAPIPGKGTIGIEVPNTKKTIVSMRTMLDDEKFKNSPFALPIAIGKRIDNTNFIVDLASMPHLLMAGATGQGKSVGLNAILVSLLYKKHPSQLKFVLVDPKKVELNIYKAIEKHFLAKLPGEEDSIITDTKKVVHTLNALCIEMDNRYDLLKEAGCRNIREYNEKFVARKLNPEKGHQFLPFIVLVVDEFADLIMTAGKEVEMPIARLAQLARAIGIHLIIATQRPSVNIITGTIKANFPARIAFKVSSKIDSRTILDTGGAEQLIGKGDMLISYNGELVRLQCAFVDTPEVDKIVDFIGDQRGYADAFLLPEYVDEKEMESRGDFDLNNKDALFEDAARLIVSSQSGSTSLIQRRLKLGYNRAGRLMDQLEAAGIVGPNQGSKVRDVLVKTDADLQMLLNDMGN
ncbi:DNA translocase FtsK 4TM domain-containing protein [Ferruginibacter yonginensis]|uniref:DNA translocase FtsK 4TM domain-containing protein n=1 Tax=Ferruginibacter yonginensis TaxID=1310416 RepID=A0ABV8QPM7_9BACT